MCATYHSGASLVTDLQQIAWIERKTSLPFNPYVAQYKLRWRGSNKTSSGWIDKDDLLVQLSLDTTHNGVSRCAFGYQSFNVFVLLPKYEEAKNLLFIL